MNHQDLGPPEAYATTEEYRAQWAKLVASSEEQLERYSDGTATAQYELGKLYGAMLATLPSQKALVALIATTPTITKYTSQGDVSTLIAHASLVDAITGGDMSATYLPTKWSTRPLLTIARRHGVETAAGIWITVTDSHSRPTAGQVRAAVIAWRQAHGDVPQPKSPISAHDIAINVLTDTPLRSLRLAIQNWMLNADLNGNQRARVEAIGMSVMLYWPGGPRQFQADLEALLAQQPEGN